MTHTVAKCNIGVALVSERRAKNFNPVAVFPDFDVVLLFHGGECRRIASRVKIKKTKSNSASRDACVPRPP